MDIKYYELVFDKNDESMCIMGVKQPTAEEATAFVKKDLDAVYESSKVTEVTELTQEQASYWFDFEDEKKNNALRVFGTDKTYGELCEGMKDYSLTCYDKELGELITYTEVQVTDIEWDTDGEEVDPLILPTEMDIPFSELYISDDVSYDELVDEISDYLSNSTGYCHNGFSINNEDLIKQALDNAETLNCNVETVMNKIEDFKKEMEEISVSKLQANKEKEEIVNDIFNKKIKEDIKEIYPVIDALAVEIGYDAVILRLGVSHYPHYWGLDFKQKDEIIGSEGSSGTLLVILPTDAAEVNSSTAIYADKTTIEISDELKTEDVAMKWQNAKEDIFSAVTATINNVLNNERTTLNEMRKENQHLKQNVLKDTIEKE